MIRVTVEILPHGREQDHYTVGTLIIINDGSGTFTRGNYTFKLLGRKMSPMASGCIKNYPRQRKHVWVLVHQVLEAVKQKVAV